MFNWQQNFIDHLSVIFLSMALFLGFPTPLNAAPLSASSDQFCPQGMVFIPGGTFTMGSDT